MLGKSNALCSYITDDVLWFAAMPGFYSVFTLTILICNGRRNLAGQRQILIAESIKKWHMIAEITKAVIMFIGYPTWFFTTISDVFNMPE